MTQQWRKGRREVEIIVKPGNSGKTQALIERAAKDQLYIVCTNRAEAHRVGRLAVDQCLEMPFPISFEDFIARRYCARGIRGFLFDNVDEMLQQYSSVPIAAMTLTSGRFDAWNGSTPPPGQTYS